MLEQLLALESEAQTAMHDIEKETAQVSRGAQERLARRIAAIEADGAEAVRRLVRESEKHTAARIAQVNEEFAAKSAAFEEEFRRKNLRGKIFHDVLHG